MSTGEPYEKGIPIRYPSTALLCVNSENSEKFNAQGFRVDGNTPADLYINKQQPLLFGYLTRIALTEMNVQWGFSNVYEDTSTSNNNTFTVRVYNSAGVAQGIVRLSVTPGFYTAPRLGAAMQAALNGSATLTAVLGANSFTVRVGGLPTVAGDASLAGRTVLADDSRFFIETSGTGFFELLPFSFLVPGSGRLTEDLTNMTGLTPTVLSGLPYYSQILGGYSSMLRTPFIDVVSKALTTNQKVRDNDTTQAGRDSLLARLYIANEDITPREITISYAASAPFAVTGTTDNALGTREFAFRREFKFPKQIQWTNTENVDFVDIRVLDYRGEPLRYNPSVVVDGILVVQSNTNDIQFTIQATEV